MPPRSSKSAEISVKSSLRTLEILEYCDSVQRGVSVSELVSKLGYPQSSTSVLVQSMVNAGYLVHDSDGRSVLPSSRVAQLGRWIEPATSRADVRRLMQAVGDATGQTIVVGVPAKIFGRYIDVIPGRLAMRLEIPVGAKMPLVASGMGCLLLSAMSHEQVAGVHDLTVRTKDKLGKEGLRASDIADRWNDNPLVPPLADLNREIEKIRKAGYSISLDAVTLGAGILCVLLPTKPGEQPIGMGVAGLSTLILRDRDAILNIIRTESDKLGMALPGLAKRRRTSRKAV